MASNGIGRGYPRGGRTPQFLTFGLLVVICILAFNYWNVSSRSKLLQKQVQEMTGTLEELAMKKVHLEKRSEALQSQIADANHANTNLRQQKETCEKETDLSKRENTDVAERLQIALSDKTTLQEILEKEKLNATQTIRLLAEQREKFEELKLAHEHLEQNTLGEKEMLSNNLRKANQDKEYIETAMQGYRTQAERLQYSLTQCQNQLQQQQQQQQQVGQQQQQQVGQQEQQPGQSRWQDRQQQRGQGGQVPDEQQRNLHNLMQERYRQQQQQQAQQQDGRLVYKPEQQQQLGQQGLVPQQQNQNELFQQGQVPNQEQQQQEQQDDQLQLQQDKLQQRQDQLQQKQDFLKAGEGSRQVAQETGEGKIDHEENKDPGIPGMLVEDDTHGADMKVIKPIKIENQEGSRHEAGDNVDEKDGGLGGEHPREKEGEIDIGQEEQKEFYKKQQEEQEQQQRSQIKDEEEGDRMQIADPREHKQIDEDKDQDGESNVGAQVHPPGDTAYGNDPQDDEDVGLEEDERQHEAPGENHIPLMKGNNIDGDNAEGAAAKDDRGDAVPGNPAFGKETGNEGAQQNLNQIADRLRQEYDLGQNNLQRNQDHLGPNGLHGNQDHLGPNPNGLQMDQDHLGPNPNGLQRDDYNQF